MRWRQRAETVLRHLIDRHSRQGQHSQALRYARRLLRAFPWNEAMHRQVMRLLVWTGQRAAALKQFEACRTILREELGVTVTPETIALYERIKQNSTLVMHNLPTPTTPFIGREAELAQLAGWLNHRQVRLSTITGMGGVGKTRLALATARRLLEPSDSPFAYSPHFPDGLFFISLAPLQSGSQIVPAIAQTLEFRFSGRDNPEQQLQAYLADKQLLLILDNFEHLLDGVSSIADLLQAAPRVSVLITSRERLSPFQENEFRKDDQQHSERFRLDPDLEWQVCRRVWL